MAVLYIPDPVAKRLKDTADRQRRTTTTVIEIMLDFEDQRWFSKKEKKTKQYS